jgi:choline dehydrogenase
VLANRLSADGRNSVLVLEAGIRDRNLFLKMPLAWRKVSADKRFTWGYFSEPERQLNDRRLSLPRGRLLGGSSSIDGTI